MSQMPLFQSKDPEAYRSPYRSGLPGEHGRHDTERAAAYEAVWTANETTRAVYRLLLRRGSEGATYTELQQALGIGSAQQRLSDLVQRGLVVDSGHRRLTPRKRKAIVWRAKK